MKLAILFSIKSSKMYSIMYISSLRLTHFECRNRTYAIVTYATMNWQLMRHQSRVKFA